MSVNLTPKNLSSFLLTASRSLTMTISRISSLHMLKKFNLFQTSLRLFFRCICSHVASAFRNHPITLLYFSNHWNHPLLHWPLRCFFSPTYFWCSTGPRASLCDLLYLYFVLTRFFNEPASNTGMCLLPSPLGNFLGPLVPDPFFDTAGRRQMITGTYATSALLLILTIWIYSFLVLQMVDKRYKFWQILDESPT